MKPKSLIRKQYSIKKNLRLTPQTDYEKKSLLIPKSERKRTRNSAMFIAKNNRGRGVTKQEEFLVEISLRSNTKQQNKQHTDTDAVKRIHMSRKKRRFGKRTAMDLLFAFSIWEFFPRNK